jgi:hypothetical protein
VLLLAKKRSALTALQDQFRARDTPRSTRRWSRAWPLRLKVIDLPLHKTLDAAGERHVRVVPDEHADGRRSITWCGGRRLRRLQRCWTWPSRPAARTRSACTWRTAATPSSATPSTATSRATSAGARRSSGMRFGAHVPARPRAGLRPPGQRRAHHPAGAPAGRLRDTAVPSDMTPRAASTSSPSTGTAPCSTRTALITRCIQHACRDLGLPVPSDADAAYVIGLGLHDACSTPRPRCRASATRAGPPLPPPLLRAPARAGAVPGHAGDAAGAEARNHWLAVATGKSRRAWTRRCRSPQLGALFDATRTADETRSKPTRRCCRS